MFRDEDSEFTTVPAAPGWYVSVLYSGLDYLTDEPIVAWGIEGWTSSSKGDFSRWAPRSAQKTTSTTTPRRTTDGCCAIQPGATMTRMGANLPHKKRRLPTSYHAASDASRRPPEAAGKRSRYSAKPIKVLREREMSILFA